MKVVSKEVINEMIGKFPKKGSSVMTETEADPSDANQDMENSRASDVSRETD